MQRSLQISDVGEPPMSVDQAKAYLRVLHSDDDEQIRELILEAYGIVEARTGRMIRTCSAVLTMSAFPEKGGQIVLPRPPLTAVESVKYYGTSNTLLTLSNPLIHEVFVPGLLALPIGSNEWPATYKRADAVEIKFSAGGYEPEQLRNAVRILIDLSYNDHEPTKASQMERRADGIMFGYTLRDPRLYGITT